MNEFEEHLCPVYINISCIAGKGNSYKEKKIMATSSITKKFVIKDNEACDRLLHAIDAAKRSPQRVKRASTKYEEGKKLLAQYFSR